MCTYVPSLSVNLWVPQLTHIGKKVEFWADWFIVKDVNNWEVIAEGFLDHKEHKFYDVPKKYFGTIAFIDQANDLSKVWHE